MVEQTVMVGKGRVVCLWGFVFFFTFFSTFKLVLISPYFLVPSTRYRDFDKICLKRMKVKRKKKKVKQKERERNLMLFYLHLNFFLSFLGRGWFKTGFLCI